MTDYTVTVTTDNTDPATVDPSTGTGIASVSLVAPEAPEEAQWFLHGHTTPFATGETTTVLVDEQGKFVLAGRGDTLDTDDLSGEFVVGVVWYVDEGDEWVRHDATRTLRYD